MKYAAFVLATATLLSSAGAATAAQSSAALKTCTAKAKTQLALDACASAEAVRADKQMQAVYNLVLSRAAAQPGAVLKVKAAQTAWIAYCKAYIDATYPAADKREQYGSIYPMQVNLLYASLTERHSADLKALLQQYTNPGH